MNDVEWTEATSGLAAAADRLAVLARCLDVVPQLQTWRASADKVAGGDAANALDQARGELERLAAGDAQVLLHLVEQLLTQLPPAWE